MSVADDPSVVPDLKGVRVLVVEDEMAISLLIEDMLLDFGCEVVGPVDRVSAALRIAGSNGIDVAILDVNLAGEPIYPVVDALAARNVPFVFSTGYGTAGVAEEHRHRPVLDKPFGQRDLEQKLRAALAGAGVAVTGA
jgi:CheY-like chemotaxis protein